MLSSFPNDSKIESLDWIQTSGLEFDYNPVLSWPEAAQSGVMGGADKLLGSRYLRGPNVNKQLRNEK